jgi:hypothetical protein
MKLTAFALSLLASTASAQNTPVWQRTLDLEVRDGRITVFATDQGSVVIAPFRVIRNEPGFDGASVSASTDAAGRWAAQERGAEPARPISAFSENAAVTFIRATGGQGAVTLGVPASTVPAWSLELSRADFERLVSAVGNAARSTAAMTADRATRPPPPARSAAPPLDPATARDTTKVYPPSAQVLFIPPLPVPPSVRGRTVTAQLTIDATGAVRHMRVASSGDTKYDYQLGEVLTQTAFRPARAWDGRPVTAVLTHSIRF